MWLQYSFADHGVEGRTVEIGEDRANAHNVGFLPAFTVGLIDADKDARALGIQLGQRVVVLAQRAVPDLGKRVRQQLFALFLAQFVGLRARLLTLLVIIEGLKREACI